MLVRGLFFDDDNDVAGCGYCDPRGICPVGDVRFGSAAGKRHTVDQRFNPDSALHRKRAAPWQRGLAVGWSLGLTLLLLATTDKAFGQSPEPAAVPSPTAGRSLQLDTSGAAKAATAGSLSGPTLSGGGVRLPVRGVAPAGFRLVAEHGELSRFGTLPLRLIVTPTGVKFPEDRVLSIRLAFAPASVAPSGRAANYEWTVRLPAGGVRFDQIYYLPKWFLGGSLNLTVWEAGQPIDGYSADLGSGNGGSYSRFGVNELESDWVDSNIGRFGWIAAPGRVPMRAAQTADDVEDLRVLLAGLAPEMSRVPMIVSPENRLAVLREFGEPAGLSYFTIEELPAHWLGFEHCQVWATSWHTLLALAEQNPAAAGALTEHLRCGGTLWLLETPAIERVAEHFGTMIFPPDPPEEEDATADAAAEEVIVGSPLIQALASAGVVPDPTTGEIRFPLEGSPWLIGRAVNEGLYFEGNLRFRRELAENLRRLTGFSEAATETGWLLDLEGGLVETDIQTLPVGFGRVVCCGRDGSIPGSFSQWQTMLMATGPGVSTVLRRGVDPVVGDSRFWNWIIPGVAQPPIYTFLGLLTLFVLLVGPVAYRTLNRMGRVHLIFLVAPLLAALTTAALFAYGLVADGLGTTARIRQVTWLCDDQGNAARYWRATYFSGLRTASGLRFPRDSRVEPYYPNQFSNWSRLLGNDPNPQGTVVLGDTSVSFTGGFFPSRQQRQFVAYQPLELKGGLTWLPVSGPAAIPVTAPETKDEPADDEAVPRADSGSLRSDFTIPLREIILRDLAGDHWLVERLAAGETVAAKKLLEEEASMVVGERYTRQMPVAENATLRSSSATASRFDLSALLSSSYPLVHSLSTARAGSPESDVEWWLRENLQTESRLPRGMFLAIADVSEDCIAVPDATLVDSIHYVIGGWR